MAIPMSASNTQDAPGAREGLLPFQVRDHFPGRARGTLELSLIAPVYDEEENVERLHARVVEIFGERAGWELILVDDGSRDRSPELIRALSRRDPRVTGVFFARNCGQTAATAAGIQVARGKLVATMDADLQNDPADLPAMIELAARHDAVVGWRKKRRDTYLRRISSRIANGIRNWISKDSIRDTGCSLKVFRAEAIQALPLFEGMHRFLPTLLRYHGYDVVEHGVGHHPRTAGISKYGVWNRVFRATKDLIAVRWMRARLLKLPIREVTGGR
ncbi:MAG: glycosyltransferase family 2 protein [Planctomycetota bacterium]|nr:glycosyltransferase family 2 protein [Planctomycetota bacterium]